jgi:hypothetical protein
MRMEPGPPVSGEPDAAKPPLLVTYGIDDFGLFQGTLETGGISLVLAAALLIETAHLTLSASEPMEGTPVYQRVRAYVGMLEVMAEDIRTLAPDGQRGRRS